MAAKQKLDVQLKRAYDPPSPDDGTRVLVDRLWPRGVRKADLAIADWLKDVAPSHDLRKWFGHDSARWDGFRRRYERELADQAETLKALRERARLGPLTLVYAARDAEHNEAIVLRDMLMRKARPPTHTAAPRRRRAATKRGKKAAR